MYAFQLWREYKLSIAEIYALFPTAIPVYVDDAFCILDIDSLNKIIRNAPRMWGVIKIIEIEKTSNISECIVKKAEKHEWKFRYGLSIFWARNLKKILMEQKRALKIAWVSARFVNKNFENLSSAQIIGEKLVERWSDFNVIQVPNTSPSLNSGIPFWKKGGNNSARVEYVWTTIWVQDIDAYSKRDYGKTRDMQVGMLPPKLAQIMMNIATSELSSQGKNEATIYDPFCGLWTILIESILMWNTTVYWSDISPENIEKTKKNLNYTRNNFENLVKTAEARVLDAKWISSSPFLKKTDTIVTEGYLGQAFFPHSVTLWKIEDVKKELLEIYTKFFMGLQKANFRKPIVISFPFWEIQWKYYYFIEIYVLIKKYGKTLPLLPRMDDIKHTKSWSLLYKRPGQVVGREIFKIKIL